METFQRQKIIIVTAPCSIVLQKQNEKHHQPSKFG